MSIFATLNENSGAIQAISNTLLVFITVGSLWLTRSAVKEAEKTRKDVRLPILILDDLNGPFARDPQSGKCCVHIYIANIGYGIATNISVNFLSEKPMVFKKHLDNDNSHHLFRIEFEPDYREILPTLTDNEKVVRVEYEDIFGRKIMTLNNFTYMAYASAAGLQAKPSDWHLKLPGNK